MNYIEVPERKKYKYRYRRVPNGTICHASLVAIVGEFEKQFQLKHPSGVLVDYHLAQL